LLLLLYEGVSTHEGFQQFLKECARSVNATGAAFREQFLDESGAVQLKQASLFLSVGDSPETPESSSRGQRPLNGLEREEIGSEFQGTPAGGMANLRWVFMAIYSSFMPWIRPCLAPSNLGSACWFESGKYSSRFIQRKICRKVCLQRQTLGL
jgi:hypothetical protein